MNLEEVHKDLVYRRFPTYFNSSPYNISSFGSLTCSNHLTCTIRPPFLCNFLNPTTIMFFLVCSPFLFRNGMYERRRHLWLRKAWRQWIYDQFPGVIDISCFCSENLCRKALGLIKNIDSLLMNVLIFIEPEVSMIGTGYTNCAFMGPHIYFNGIKYFVAFLQNQSNLNRMSSLRSSNDSNCYEHIFV